MLPLSIKQACADITDILGEILDLESVILADALDFTDPDNVGLISAEFSVHASLRKDLSMLLYELVTKHDALTAPAEIVELFDGTRTHIISLLEDVFYTDVADADADARLILQDMHDECCEGIGELGALLRDLVTDVTKQRSTQTPQG